LRGLVFTRVADIVAFGKSSLLFLLSAAGGRKQLPTFKFEASLLGYLCGTHSFLHWGQSRVPEN